MTRPARPEVLALLADVKENPDDLTPWLVLTDWLDEHGDEADRARAEYCRLCFDKLGKKTYASDWEKGERRRGLFREWKDTWLGPIGITRVEGGYLCQSQMRRGLVTFGGTADFLLELYKQGIDLERWAWVEELTLFNLSLKEAKAITSCPLLSGPAIIRLQLLARMNPVIVKAWANSPYLTGVRELHVSARLIRGTYDDEQFFRPLRDRFGEALKLSIHE